MIIITIEGYVDGLRGSMSYYIMLYHTLAYYIVVDGIVLYDVNYSYYITIIL